MRPSDSARAFQGRAARPNEEGVPFFGFGLPAPPWFDEPDLPEGVPEVALISYSLNPAQD
jgi:hypothetical protein